MTLRPDPRSRFLLRLVPRCIPHIPLTGRSNRRAVIVQLPQRVGLELKGQRDERQDPADDMVVCVFSKGFDFRYERGGSFRVLGGGMSERLALEVIMLSARRR
jgi:hypothetical protein